MTGCAFHMLSGSCQEGPYLSGTLAGRLSQPGANAMSRPRCQSPRRQTLSGGTLDLEARDLRLEVLIPYVRRQLGGIPKAWLRVNDAHG